MDVYVDSVSTFEREVIITTVLTDDAGVAEIPVAAAASQPNGTSLFENSVGFEDPVLSIAAIEELDPITDGLVLRTLVPDTHFVLVRAEKRGRFTQVDEDVLIIRGRDDTGAPLFNGSRLRIRYLTNPDFATIQSFVSDTTQRDVTKDILIKTPEIVFLDVDFAYRGVITLDDVKSIVTEFIAEKSFRPTITVNEIVTALAFFGVTDIEMPMTLTSRFDQGDGEVAVASSQDRISAGRVQIFRAVPDLSIRKLG